MTGNGCGLQESFGSKQRAFIWAALQKTPNIWTLTKKFFVQIIAQNDLADLRCFFVHRGMRRLSGTGTGDDSGGGSGS
jgi:hypothetical protein